MDEATLLQQFAFVVKGYTGDVGSVKLRFVQMVEGEQKDEGAGRALMVTIVLGLGAAAVAALICFSFLTSSNKYHREAITGMQSPPKTSITEPRAQPRSDPFLQHQQHQQQLQPQPQQPQQQPQQHYQRSSRPGTAPAKAMAHQPSSHRPRTAPAGASAPAEPSATERLRASLEGHYAAPAALTAPAVNAALAALSAPEPAQQPSTQRTPARVSSPKMISTAPAVPTAPAAYVAPSASAATAAPAAPAAPAALAAPTAPAAPAAPEPSQKPAPVEQPKYTLQVPLLLNMGGTYSGVSSHNVSDAAGKAVLTVHLMLLTQETQEMGAATPSLSREGSGISPAEYVSIYSSNGEELALCALGPGKRGRWECNLHRGENELFGYVVQDSKGPASASQTEQRYVLIGHPSGERLLTLQGRLQERRAELRGADGALAAVVEPGPAGPAGTSYKVMCTQHETFAGLVLPFLLGVDRLRSRCSSKPHSPM